jgi:NAD(P)-dependent dehydrogenase (short-subunit alcohol dehydrogenase family)
MKPLQGKVAVVAGATRGAGRGIAIELGEAGATVYMTGRSVRGKPSSINRPETIEETAEIVNAREGVAIPVKVDHTIEGEVKTLFERIKHEQGRLDLLINNICGSYILEWDKPFWEHSLQKGLRYLEQAVHSHIITSHYGVRLMLERNQGLIVETTDGDGKYYFQQLFYDLAKVSTIRLAFAMAEELRKHNITMLALAPGWMRIEAMLDRFSVTEENWQEAIKKDPKVSMSESPRYVGRAVVALASDPNVIEKSGKALRVSDLAREYSFTDIDGRQPVFSL